MCSSRTKRWIVGLVLLTAAALAAAGYLMSGKPAERADKGTLVRQAEDGMRAAGAKAGDGIRAMGAKAGDGIRAMGAKAGGGIRAVGAMLKDGARTVGGCL